MTHSALLIIDMQNGVINKAYQKDIVINNILQMIDQARSTNTPIIWISHEDNDLKLNTPEWSLVKELTPLKNETHIVKKYNDAFDQTDLMNVLTKMNIQTLYISGAQTDACIRATLHGSFVRGFNTVLISDAHTTEDLSEFGLPQPEILIQFTNIYWKFHTGSNANAKVLPTTEVKFN